MASLAVANGVARAMAGIASQMRNNPRFRSGARRVVRRGVQRWGKRRAGRASSNRWYAGRRVGIPARLRIPSRITSQPVSRSVAIAPRPAANTLRQVGTEWLCDVVPTTTLTNGVYTENYPINPAEVSTFPRLANIATQYQKYTVSGVSVLYSPTCATSQVGTIYLAALRDPSTPAPQTALEIQGLNGVVRGAVREPLALMMDTSNLSNALRGFYCDKPADPSWTDHSVTKTVGRFCMLLDGVPTGTKCGTLSISYSFVFSDPKTDPAGASLSGYHTFENLESGTVPYHDGVVSGTPCLYPHDSVNFFVKRTYCPVALIVSINSADAAVGTLQVYVADGSSTTEIDSNFATSTVAYFVLPAGRWMVILTAPGDYTHPVIVHTSSLANSSISSAIPIVGP